ncbi:MAG: MlaD family protein [Ignavibacteria bacterium]
MKNLGKVRLGAFVIFGTALMILAVFLIAGKESLFSPAYTIKSRFTTVEGLRNGAMVRLSGINIGSIKDIELANDTTGNVIVTMRIGMDVMNFIRQDTRASIETEGLVGNKIIVLSVGSTAYNVIRDNGYVRSVAPVNMAQIIAEGQGTISYLKSITKDFSEIMDKINSGEGTIGKIINDNELYDAATHITRSADKSLTSITGKLNEISDIVRNTTGNFQVVMANLDTVVVNVGGLITDVKMGKGILGALVTDKGIYTDSVRSMLNNLTVATNEVRIGVTRFSENMEALKHNWLFKSYFEERGYWDVAQYEKSIDGKLAELKEKTRALDEKIKELRASETETGVR